MSPAIVAGGGYAVQVVSPTIFGDSGYSRGGVYAVQAASPTILVYIVTWGAHYSLAGRLVVVAVVLSPSSLSSSIVVVASGLHSWSSPSSLVLSLRISSCLSTSVSSFYSSWLLPSALSLLFLCFSWSLSQRFCICYLVYCCR